MILETAQMLSTAMRLLDDNHPEDIYRLAQPTHPCNLWIRKRRQNFIWLLRHGEALAEQRDRNSEQPHRSGRIFDITNEWLRKNPDLSWEEPDGVFQFVNCAANTSLGISFKHIEDIPEAYRQYISARWDSDTLANHWNNGERPPWYEN